MKALATLVLLLSVSGLLFAQGQAPAPRTVVPDSSTERSEDVGHRAHTNHLVHIRPFATGTAPTGETPQSIYPVYGLTFDTLGGSGTIAIVDANDYPTAENDLNVFSQQFGLPACTTANGCFQKVYASGVKPTADCGWAQEAALDIEWAHAMAPKARIILVEAASASFTDLFKAVDVATSLVTAGGGKGQVSMSWGGSEFSGETSYDSHFINNGVVYFGASGDSGGIVIYPGSSPDVVAAGGTTIHRSSTGAFLSETGWSGTGGGPSRYEKRPSYQGAISTIVGTARGVPDFSFDADPASGVSVYDSTICQKMVGWMVFGGTSVASPSLAGIVNRAGHNYANTMTELTTIYSNLGNASDFRDITSGTAGRRSAAKGWDYVTGVGSNQGLNGK